MTTEDALIEQIIRAIADHIGHGMAEKCEGVAKAALAIALPAIEAEMRAEVEKLRGDLAKYVLAYNELMYEKENRG